MRRLQPIQFGREFAALGYALVVQDCRGTGRSQGKWEPFIHEGRDGADTHKWVLKQRWCNGRIGTFGGSYVGFTQWATASEEDGPLNAMLTDVPAFNWYEVRFNGGAYRLELNTIWDALMVRPGIGGPCPLRIDTTKQPWKFTLKNGEDWDAVFRHLPLMTWDERIGETIPWVRLTLNHPEFDTFWEGSSTKARLGKVGVPNLTCSGWYDMILNQALHYVPELRRQAANATARRHQHLVIGPWGHMLGEPIGELEFGPAANFDFADMRRRWFGRWLKEENKEVDEWPFLRLFVMGDNCWREENDWPLARTRYTPYYLHSQGSANTRDGNGLLNTGTPSAEPPDRYVYDPADPVPTHGGRSNFITPCGSQDQRTIETRKDVLVYTGEKLGERLEVTGPVKVILYAATDAPDTDWTAKLVDVHPDGRAFNICDGILRARYRESLTKAKLLEPNKIYRYEIDLWATSNVFKPGHRIRVQVSSSNFPCFDRNPNTGHAFGVDRELRKANQTVYHDQEHPSHVLLPVIPE